MYESKIQLVSPIKFRWLDFKITNRCNNKCVYCGGSNDPPSIPEKLSFEIKTLYLFSESYI